MHSTDFYTLGKGILYFSKKNEDGSYQGHRDLGNSPSFSTSIDLTLLEHFSSRKGLKAKDKKIVQTSTPKVKFTLDEPNMKNLSLLNLGNLEEIVQEAGKGFVDTFDVKEQDVYLTNQETGKRNWEPCPYLRYDGGSGMFAVDETVTGDAGATAIVKAVIGDVTSGILLLDSISGNFVDGENLTGSVSGLAVANGSQVIPADNDVLVCKADGSVVYTLDTDYTLDLTRGRIFIKSGGAITSPETISVGYNYGKVKYSRISVSSDTMIEGELHFISDNPVGENIEILFWRVVLTPSGDFNLIGDNWETLGFDGEILIDTENHPSLPYGQILGDIETMETTTTT